MILIFGTLCTGNSFEEIYCTIRNCFTAKFYENYQNGNVSSSHHCVPKFTCRLSLIWNFIQFFFKYFLFLLTWQRTDMLHSSFSWYVFSSDYLTYFLHREEKENRQNLPPVRIEPRTSGSSCQCSTNWAKSTFSCQPESSWPLQSHVLLILEMTKVQNVKWCMKESSLQKSSGQHIPG